MSKEREQAIEKIAPLFQIARKEGALRRFADGKADAENAIAEFKSLGYVQKDPDQPKIICLCGSGRFRDAFESAEFDETLKGNIVLTIGCNTHDIARTKELEHLKPILDKLHLRKIDLADEVLILNVGGYIGESTRNELDYAISKNKKVVYLEPI